MVRKPVRRRVGARYGVNIQTIDNPGWSVGIDVAGTSAEGVAIPRFRSTDFDENDQDWVECGLSEDEASFGGVGDQKELAFIVDYFLRHVKSG